MSKFNEFTCNVKYDKAASSSSHLLLLLSVQNLERLPLHKKY